MEQPSKFKFKLQLPYVDRTYKQFTAPQPPLILECTLKLEIEILLKVPIITSSFIPIKRPLM